MKELYLKLEEAKKNYELKKEQINERNKEILESISLTDRVVLRTYKSEKQTINLFQKDVVFTKLKEKYHILHEENNPNYIDIEAYSKYSVDDINIYHMYILIPKEGEEKPLCLFIKRCLGSYIDFASFDQEDEEILCCYPKICCEKSIYAYLSEYDFETVFVCSIRSLCKGFYSKIELKKDNYVDTIKEYIRENYLNKTFTFISYESDSLKKYVKCPEKYLLEGVDKVLSSVLQSNYDKFKNGGNLFETFVVDKFKIECNVSKKNEKVRAEVRDERKETDKYLGYVNIDMQIMEIEVKIFKSGILTNKLIDKRVIELREEKTFEDVLNNYINKDFWVSI